MKSIMFVLPLVLIACGSAEKAATPQVEKQATVNAAAPSAKVVEALKVADAADGTEDKVAQKCAGCALAMDGDAANTIKVDGYELHMCAASCKSYFEKDVAGNLSTLVQ
ncbi:MAG: hypothetical protein CL930_08625 [Deltaproteobacteria bacterium]|nr:hypothetical protein [Deltaproteobacteria bacterium]